MFELGEGKRPFNPKLSPERVIFWLGTVENFHVRAEARLQKLAMFG